MAELTIPFRTSGAWRRLEARQSVLFVSAAGLVTWLQLSAGPVRFAPLALAISLVIGDVAATTWAARIVTISSVSTPSLLDDDTVIDLEFHAPAPFAVEALAVFGSHHLDTSIGDGQTNALADRHFVRARCPEGQPDAITAMTVDIRCQTLGLVSVRRTHSVVFDAPRSIFVDERAVSLVRSQGEDRLREYRTGDARHRIHWPVTARTGQLHVRAADDDGFEQLLVVVEVDDDQQRSEVLRRAFDEIAPALSAGRLVRLITYAIAEQDRDRAVARLLVDPRRQRAAKHLEQTVTAEVSEGLVHDRAGLVRRLACCRAGSVPSFGPDEVRIS